MKRIFPLLLALLTACSNPSSPEHPSTYVSTLVGTQSDYSFSTGNTYPAIAVPWGMNFWTPVTAQREDDGWAYQYEKKKHQRLQADAPAFPLDRGLRRFLHHALHRGA